MHEHREPVRPSVGGPGGLRGRGGLRGPGIDRRTLLRSGLAVCVALATGASVDIVVHGLGPGGPTDSPRPDVGSSQAGDPRVASSELSRTRATPVSVEPTAAPPRPAAGASPTSQPTVATTAPPSGPRASTAFFCPSAGRHVYVTIDDGYFPDSRVIDMMRSEHLPLTTFLIAEAASEHKGFWKLFAQAGGQIQNHTYSHPLLTGMPQGEVEGQWARTNHDFARWFGVTPTVGRPPYGGLDATVSVAAAEAGLTSMIMWSALDSGTGIQTWNKAPISPGSIILLHWTPSLYGALAQVLQAVSDHHLVPAFLPGT